MKTIVATAAFAAIVLGAAAPAAAQSFSAARIERGYSFQSPYVRESDRQLDRLRYQLRNGIRRGAITSWEARRLRPELRSLQRLRIHYIRSRGMSRWEAYDLRRRINNFRVDLNRALHNRRGHAHRRAFRW